MTRLWSLRDVARELQIDPKTLTRYVEQLGIEPRKAGVRKLITEEDVERICRELPPPPTSVVSGEVIQALSRRVEELERRVKALEQDRHRRGSTT
jgi:predicted site-specific integrase-resolvase